MPKLKTHSGTKDRVKLTKNGKVLVRHSSRNHFMEQKSAARKRTMNGTQELSGKPAKNIKLRLGA